MMKLVYYPSFFRLRRWGTKRAIVASTVIVFATTWLLHSYQWFWLRGGFPVTVTDILFWGLLGGLVVANSLREVRRGRDRRAGRRRWDPMLALRTIGIFATICVLWSLWSAESLIEWLWMLRAATNAEPVHIAVIGGTLLLAIVLAGVSWDTVLARRTAVPLRAALARSAALVALLVLAQPAAFESKAPTLAAAIMPLTESSLNAQDMDRQVNGYYENLDGPSRRNLQLWDVSVTRSRDWQELSETGVVSDRDDFVGWELEPSSSVTWNGHRLTTNRWGMRDRDYAATRPDSTVRIAMLGASHAMGSNVSDDEVFETLVESRLNRDLGPTTGIGYEILNFAVAGFALPQQVALLEERVFGFQPDIMMLVASTQGRARVAQNLLRAAERGHAPPDPAVRELFDAQGLGAASAQGMPVPFHPFRHIAAALGLPTRMPWQEARLRARDIAEEVELVSLIRGAELAREQGVTPILVLLDLVVAPEADVSRLIGTAEQHGYTVLDLLDVYHGHNAADLRVAPWDNHPNARGHELIADRLYYELASSRLLAPTFDAPDRATIVSNPGPQ